MGWPYDSLGCLMFYYHVTFIQVTVLPQINRAQNIVHLFL